MMMSDRREAIAAALFSHEYRNCPEYTWEMESRNQDCRDYWLGAADAVLAIDCRVRADRWSDHDRIAAVLKTCGLGCYDDVYTDEDLLDIADVLIAAGVTMPAEITTTEQLDALPFLTVIREVRHAGRDCIDYGAIYERRTSGWQCIAGMWTEPERNGPPSLPVRVLWRCDQ